MNLRHYTQRIAKISIKKAAALGVSFAIFFLTFFQGGSDHKATSPHRSLFVPTPAFASGDSGGGGGDSGGGDSGGGDGSGSGDSGGGTGDAGSPSGDSGGAAGAAASGDSGGAGSAGTSGDASSGDAGTSAGSSSTGPAGGAGGPPGGSGDSGGGSGGGGDSGGGGGDSGGGGGGGGGGGSASAGGGGAGGAWAPTVTLLSKPGQSPYAFVYLSQVPYTGFDGGPVAKTLFYTALILWSAFLSYLFTASMFGRRLFAAISSRLIPSAALRTPEKDKPVTLSRVEVAAAPLNLPTEYEEGGLETVLASARRKPAVADENLGEIEEAAHGQRLLMSGEALRALLERFGVSEAPRMLSTVAERAKALYPREDGWVHLNKERLLVILGKDASAAASPVFSVPPTAPAAKEAAAPERAGGAGAAPGVSRPAPFSTSVFFELLAAGNERELFEQIKQYAASGANFGALTREAVLSLDELHRFLVERSGSPETALAAAFSRFSPAEIERLMEILLSGVDARYASPSVAAKVTLLRALDFVKKK